MKFENSLYEFDIILNKTKNSGTIVFIIMQKGARARTNVRLDDAKLNLHIFK